MPDRTNQLKVMLSDEELEMLRTLSEGQGLNVSDFVRQWLRREFAALEPAPKKKR